MLTGYKLHTGGNDFIFVETFEISVKTIQEISNRKLGIGCDQFFCYKVDTSEVLVKIFNSDGSLAKNCGNGMLACGVLMNYLYNLKNFTVDTHFIKMTIDIDSETVKLTLPTPNIEGDFGNIGNIHKIIFNESDVDIKKIPSNDYNENYVKLLSEDEIEVKTIERGCGYTSSCGSGNICSAFYMYKKNYIMSNKINIKNEHSKYVVEIFENKVVLSGKSSLIAKFSYFDN
jgi:diaminopimelate epimerase